MEPAMPRWLIALLALASLCVIAVTAVVIAFVIAFFAAIGPGLSEELNDLADSTIEDVADEAEAAVADGLRPTQRTLEEMREAIIAELGPLRETMQNADELLAKIEQAIAAINARDAELAELQREAAAQDQ